MHRLFNHFPHYFKKRLPLELEELYLSTGIMDFAASAIALFEPIYLWTLGYRVKEIMLFYLLAYVTYYFLLPLGGKFVARFGHERSISISTAWLVAYAISLIGIGNYPNLFYLAPLLLALQKTFYWPAYHFDFMRFSLKEERASEFSGLWSITTLMYTLGPIAGGVIVKFFGFTELFVMAAVVILLSSIPLFATRSPRKRETFSYWKSFVLPFRRRYQRSTVGYLGLGSELILLTTWPIVMSLIFKDFFAVGLVVGVSALLTALSTLAIGKWSDRSSKTNVLAAGGVIGAALWIVRSFTRFGPLVFGLDTLSRVSHNMSFVSMTALTYDRAHEDDYSWHGVYYEQGFALAKSFTAALVFIFSSVADPFNVSFVVAAVLSLLYLVF